jgi:hypothetical protein
MIAPTFVVLVHIAWLMFSQGRQNVYWMVTDLAPGKMRFGIELGRLDQPGWVKKQIGAWKSPEGKTNCVKSTTIGQDPDHHPSLQ